MNPLQKLLEEIHNLTLEIRKLKTCSTEFLKHVMPNQLPTICVTSVLKKDTGEKIGLKTNI